MCSSNKIGMPKYSLKIMWTLIFEQDVVKCRSHNQKDLCFNEITLCA